MTSQPIASIIHLSDLHLYADPELTDFDPHVRAEARRRFKKKVWLTKRLGALFRLDKLDVCNTVALAALEEALSEYGRNAATDGGPESATVVVHTGDVETLGPRVEPDGTAHFDGFDYLHSKLRDAVMDGVAWVDVYGNHDVWGGAWPVFERLAGLDEHSENFERIRNVDGLDSYAFSIPLASACPQATIQVRRVNSIDPDFVAATFAWGKVGSHPVGEDVVQVCEALQGSWGQSQSATIVVVAMHHPPHAFGDGWWIKRWFGRRFGSARLAGASELAATMAGNVKIVLAGHRHKADPSEGAAPPFTQPPLISGETVQLVAPSPTSSKHLAHFDAESLPDQQGALQEMRSRAFPRYELEFSDDSAPRLKVWRVMHRLDSDTQTADGYPDAFTGDLGQRSSTVLPAQLVLDTGL